MSEPAPTPHAGPPVGLLAGVVVAVLVLALLCVGVPFVGGCLAAIAIPNFVAMQQKANRAEVPGHVDGIRIAELAYFAAFDRYVACGAPGEDNWMVGTQPHAFEGQASAACFAELGWLPDGPVRGIYWVTVTPAGDDFEVHGRCDVDGDGVWAAYMATSHQNATALTIPSVY